jgi:hypothetical protein
MSDAQPTMAERAINGHDPTAPPRTPADFPPPRYRGGKEIELADGERWRFAPLTLDLIDEGGPAVQFFAEIAAALLPLATPASTGTEIASMIGTLPKAIISLAHLSLARNYPGLTRAEVGALLDLASIPPLLEAMFALNGMQARFRELLVNLGLSPPSIPTASP